MKEMWPLWECISVEAQAALMKFQFDTYGYHLQIPSVPESKFDTGIESPEEIGKLIRQTRRHFKGAGVGY